MKSPTARRIRATIAFAVAAVALAGCANDDLAQQYSASEDQGYVAGDGSWQEFAEGDRSASVEFSGTDESGQEIASADFAGEVTVVNFWYAACPPCRAEAADLEQVYQDFRDQQVHFVGVNVYDQADTIKSFNAEFGVTYPSILDVDDAAVRLAFSDNVSPQSIPSTLVLDREGRVAAVIRGVADPSILTSMIDRVLKEEA